MRRSCAAELDCFWQIVPQLPCGAGRRQRVHMCVRAYRMGHAVKVVIDVR